MVRFLCFSASIFLLGCAMTSSTPERPASQPISQPSSDSASPQTPARGFKAQQARFERVRTAIAEKEAEVRKQFAEKSLAYPPTSIFLRAFKRERTLEVWIKQEDEYVLLTVYAVCAASGDLGPKRRQGDSQVPEGFYYIDRFNPVSNFHLSLGINYPNESDRLLGDRGNLGGDIFIHGNCVSIGCLAITDDKIKELYLLAIEARAAGQQRIPVHIFPSTMDDAGMQRLQQEAQTNPTLLTFWRNLKAGFDAFEQSRRLPSVTVDRQGQYAIR